MAAASIRKSNILRSSDAVVNAFGWLTMIRVKEDL
jgi:hypothetical protein